MNRALPLSIALFALGAGMIVIPALPESVPVSDAIVVLDGDTVKRAGVTFRLLGFDAPETGSRAKCATERGLGEAAKARLAQLIATRHPSLTQVACACAPGTEGTKRCNYGRSCAVLTVDGVDVATIMIGERLARAYVCSGKRCPQRGGWCGQ